MCFTTYPHKFKIYLCKLYLWLSTVHQGFFPCRFWYSLFYDRNSVGFTKAISRFFFLAFLWLKRAYCRFNMHNIKMGFLVVCSYHDVNLLRHIHSTFSPITRPNASYNIVLPPIYHYNTTPLRYSKLTMWLVQDNPASLYSRGEMNPDLPDSSPILSLTHYTTLALQYNTTLYWGCKMFALPVSYKMVAHVQRWLFVACILYMWDRNPRNIVPEKSLGFLMCSLL